MERQKIYNAFDNIKPSEESAYRMLDNILASASEISPTGKDGNMKKISRKPILIAAVVIVMLLTMGAVVVRLSVSDLKMGEYVIPEQTFTDENGDKITIPDETRDRISLQGVQGSPNYKAAQEWREFRDSYDQDYALLREADANGFVRPEAYQAYDVYTQEMIDKIDEICEKYGLKLAGAITIVQKEEKEIFFDTLGITQLHREGIGVEVSYSSGYFYECGNFNFHCYFKTADNTDLSCDMRYTDKAYLDTVTFTVSDIENLEQWNYTTEDGTNVLIIMEDHWARILCDREYAFISVFVTVGEPNNITKEDAEFAAEVFDFTIKPQV